MGRRRGLSTTLILGAIVLLIAIAVGNSMGNRVLGQVASRIPAFSTTPLPITTPSGAPLEGSVNGIRWKRRQVISVATDPAFPDPRITPEPTPPPPTPTPLRAEPLSPQVPYSGRRHNEYVPTPVETAEPVPTEIRRHPTYTSPPLLIPMPRRGADETATAAPDEPPSAAPAPTASRAAVVSPTSVP